MATTSLAGLGGSETYAITVADHLQRLGHEVWLHASEHGLATGQAERLGVRVAREPGQLPDEPDALIVQDGAMAYELADAYPRAPQLFVAHSEIWDFQLPPQLPGVVACVVVLYDRVERRVRALAHGCEVLRLAQPVDLERFKPTRPLPERPRIALALGNYLHGQRLEMLAGACRRAGVELRHVGLHGDGGSVASELVLNEADVVFGKARVIYEAMACGRAAYVLDHHGGDGWVTADSYAVLSADNFGGRSLPAVVDEERLVADLDAYDPRMGIVNRDLAAVNHAATNHAAALSGALARLVPRPAPLDAPLREMARLVRLYHRADGEAFMHKPRLEELHARTSRLEAELAAARAELDAAREALRAHAAMRQTRRWRAVQAALWPADRARAWSRGRSRRDH